jgi:hypothetical protein
MEKENFINEILNSTNGITKVAPNEALFFDIQNKIKHQNTISNNFLWKVAASIVILISLNIMLVVSKNNLNQKQDSAFENTLNKSNQLY